MERSDGVGGGASVGASSVAPLGGGGGGGAMEKVAACRVTGAAGGGGTTGVGSTAAPVVAWVFSCSTAGGAASIDGGTTENDSTPLFASGTIGGRTGGAAMTPGRGTDSLGCDSAIPTGGVAEAKEGRWYEVESPMTSAGL